MNVHLEAGSEPFRMVRVLMLLAAMLAASARAEPFDPFPEVLEAQIAGNEASDAMNRGAQLLLEGRKPDAMREIAESRRLALGAAVKLRRNIRSMLAADLFARRLSAAVERGLYGMVIQSQLFLNRAYPGEERAGTDLAFAAAVAGHGTLFAESLERRLAARDQPRLRRLVARFEALAELDSAVRLAEDRAKPALQARLRPLRALLLRQLDLPPGQPGLDSQYRQPLAVEREVQALNAAAPFRSWAIAAEMGAHGIAGRLPWGSLMLVYYCGLRTCYVFALHPSGEVRLALLDADREKLAADLNTLKLQLSLQASPDPDLYRRVSATLVGPVADWLRTSSYLFVLPDGPLFAFPFAALRLPDSGEPLVSRVAVTMIAGGPYLPSLRRPPEASGPALVVGVGRFRGEDPLPNAVAEARSVAALLKVDAVTGDEATRETVLARIEQAPVVHVVSHARPDGDAEMASSLVLKGRGGNDVELTALEVLSLSLRARLVVLSACETGYPAVMVGTGRPDELPPNNDPLGLVRAFLLAGAGGVVATHWAVSDEAATAVMARFYGLARDGEPFAEALRSAQDGLRRQGARPGLWAPFFFTGPGL